MPPADPLARLTSIQAGAVLAALGAAGPDAPRILARLADPDGPACAAAARAFTGGRAELTRRAAAARAQVPAGIERIHPEWRERARAGADRRIRAALDGAADTPAAVWLRRHSHADLVAMPTGSRPPVGRAEWTDLPLFEPGELIAALRGTGLRELARAHRHRPADHLAALAATLGEPDASRFLAALTAVARLAGVAGHRPGDDRDDGDRDRDRHASDRRARAARVADLPWGRDRHAATRAGARAIAPRLRGAGDLARRIAQRLPLDPGAIVLAELTGRHRLAPVDAAPTLAGFLAAGGTRATRADPR